MLETKLNKHFFCNKQIEHDPNIPLKSHRFYSVTSKNHNKNLYQYIKFTAQRSFSWIEKNGAIICILYTDALAPVCLLLYTLETILVRLLCSTSALHKTDLNGKDHCTQSCAELISFFLYNRSSFQAIWMLLRFIWRRENKVGIIFITVTCDMQSCQVFTGARGAYVLKEILKPRQ